MSSPYLPDEPDWKICHKLKCNHHLNLNGVKMCSLSSKDGSFVLNGSIGSETHSGMNKQPFSSKCCFLLEQIAAEYKKRGLI